MRKLSAEEKALEAAIGRDEFMPVTGPQLQAVADVIAARRKDTTLTIRVNSEDIRRIKQMARKKGIRYQTCLAEEIHRVARALP